MHQKIYAQQPNTNGGMSILAEQVSQLYAALGSAILANLLNAIVLVMVFWSVVDHHILLTWLAVSLLVSLLRAISHRLYTRSQPPPQAAKRWLRFFLSGSVSAAVVWAGTAIWLFPE